MSDWLAPAFRAPTRLDLPTGHHLRRIREDDVDIDYPAVMGSQARLWTIFGAAWGWPPATMTYEQDREDLRRHEGEMRRNESFNYGIFDTDETTLYGCVYLDPPGPPGADADISWWVVDDQVGGGLEAALEAAVPAWVERDWPFERPRFIGRDLSWDDWLALDRRPDP